VDSPPAGRDGSRCAKSAKSRRPTFARNQSAPSSFNLVVKSVEPASGWLTNKLMRSGSRPIRHRTSRH
jgi:hypothetical protein